MKAFLRSCPKKGRDGGTTMYLTLRSNYFHPFRPERVPYTQPGTSTRKETRSG